MLSMILAAVLSLCGEDRADHYRIVMLTWISTRSRNHYRMSLFLWWDVYNIAK